MPDSSNWKVILHFSDGETYTVPEKFASKEEAMVTLKQLLALEELLETKGDNVTGWRMSQITRWEIRKPGKLGV